jgi:FMN phosphatase YigB (HAD superfamily)
VAARALVFDVFGTLVDWRSGIADAFRASGLSGEPEELADAWRARYAAILHEVNERSRPWGNFDELHLATLDDLRCAARGADAGGRPPVGSRWRTRAGLRTAFVDRPLEYGPGSPARKYPDADESVAQLRELAARLNG